MRTSLLLPLAIILALSLPAAKGSVVVARVDENGSCIGLLSIGEEILYLNQTPIQTTADVHSYLAATRPNQTLLLTTNRQTLVVRLGGESTGKLGIGITNVNKTLLYEQTVNTSDVSMPGDTGPEPLSGGVQVVLIGLCACLCILLLSSLRQQGNRLARSMDSICSLRGRRPNFLSAIALFGVSFVARLVFTIAYLLRFGSHSTNVIELWFYVDVAKGNRYFLSPFDPTIYILRFFGLLSPEEVPFYATILCGLILSSIVPVILYFLVKDLHGPKTGFLSGLIYGCMVQPIALSTVCFTHHLTQIPLSLLFLLTLNRAVSRRGRERAQYLICSAGSAVLGYFINEEIFLYILIGYVIVAIAVVRWLLRGYNRDTGRAFALAMLVIGVLAMPLTLYYDRIVSIATSLTSKEPLPESGVQLIHQTNVQFVTAVTLPPVVYLRFYGILLILLPFGVYESWKERDLLPYLLLVLGLVVSVHWARGSRILDIGVALLVGMALGNWKGTWTLPALFIAVPVSGLLMVFLPMSYLQTYFAVSLCSLMFTLLYPRVRLPHMMAAAIAVSCSLAVSTVGLIVLETCQSSQAEFEALAWLKQNSHPGERILTALDRGHLPSAIADLQSVSDEYNYGAHIAKAFYETEELAAVTLSEHNVSYVMVSTDDLRIQTDAAGHCRMSIRGYIQYDQEFEDPEIPLLTMFRLTYPGNRLRYFEEIDRREHLGTTVRVYRVKNELLGSAKRPHPRNRTTLSIVIRNPADSAVRAWVPLVVVLPTGELRIVDSLAVDLGAGKTVSLAYDYRIPPTQALSLAIERSNVEAITDGTKTVRGFVSVSEEGPFVFEYLLTNGEIRSHVETLPPGGTFFAHDVSADGESNLPLEGAHITPLRYCQGTDNSSAEIETPSRPLIAPQLLFSQLD